MVGVKGVPAKWGGMEKYVEEIGERLVQRGHEVTVFASSWYCKDYRGDYYKGIRIARLPTLHLRATDALSNGFLAFLRIMVEPFDIVHFHGYASYCFVPLMRLSGSKTVVTCHGVDSGWDNPKYGSLARGIIKRAFESGVVHGDLVTTVASHLQKQIEDQFGVTPIVTRSGLDEQPHSPPQLIREKYGLSGMDYLLFLGRIDPVKRVDWLPDLKRSGALAAKIVIAGGAQDSASLEYFQKLKAECSSDRSIIFTGPVSGIEKSELLSNCRALLAPSMNEGLPLSVLEALSLGKCCVASDISGHSELIEDKVSGFLFDQNDKQAFIRTVESVLNLPLSRVEEIGTAGKERASGVYNWERTTDVFERAFLGVIGTGDAKKRRSA